MKDATLSADLNAVFPLTSTFDARRREVVSTRRDALRSFYHIRPSFKPPERQNLRFG